MTLIPWGPDVEVETGGAGGITHDLHSGAYVLANDPWTDSRLPLSMGALHRLRLSDLLVQPTRRYDRPAGPRDLERDIERQVGSYQHHHYNAHVPGPLLKQLLMEDALSMGLPRHSRVALVRNGNDPTAARVLVHPSGLNSSMLTFSQLGEYFEDAPEDDRPYPRLQGVETETCSFKMETPILKIQQSQVSPSLVVVCHGEVCVFGFEQRTRIGRVVTIPSSASTAIDACLTDHGRRVLASERGMARLVDIPMEQEVVRWSVPESTQHVAVSHEFAYLSAATDQLLLMDPRSQRVSSSVHPIGGTPSGLAVGQSVDELVFLAGPERLVAIDVRAQRHPVLQWKAQMCFGHGGLTGLKIVSVGGSTDCLVGLCEEQLHILPVERRASINALTSVTPRMLPSLNGNRLYARIKSPEPIIGHDIIHEPSMPCGFSSYHMADTGRAAYQFFSFSDHLAGQPPEDSSEQLDHPDIPLAKVSRSRLPTYDHSVLFKQSVCTGRFRREYGELSAEEQEAVRSWGMPLKGDRYIPKMFYPTVERITQASSSVQVDESLLSSAGRQLSKLWNI